MPFMTFPLSRLSNLNVLTEHNQRHLRYIATTVPNEEPGNEEETPLACCEVLVQRTVNWATGRYFIGEGKCKEIKELGKMLHHRLRA